MYISFFQGDQGPRGQFGMMGRKGQRVSLLLRPEIKVVFSQENVTVVRTVIGSLGMFNKMRLCRIS